VYNIIPIVNKTLLNNSRFVQRGDLMLSVLTTIKWIFFKWEKVAQDMEEETRIANTHIIIFNQIGNYRKINL